MMVLRSVQRLGNMPGSTPRRARSIMGSRRFRSAGVSLLAVAAVFAFGLDQGAKAQSSGSAPLPTDRAAKAGDDSSDRADDQGVEIVKNPDGTKTARVRLSPKSFPSKDASGKKSDADVSLVEKGRKLEAANVAEPLSLDSSSTDPES